MPLQSKPLLRPRVEFTHQVGTNSKMTKALKKNDYHIREVSLLNVSLEISRSRIRSFANKFHGEQLIRWPNRYRITRQALPSPSLLPSPWMPDGPGGGRERCRRRPTTPTRKRFGQRPQAFPRLCGKR